MIPKINQQEQSTRASGFNRNFNSDTKAPLKCRAENYGNRRSTICRSREKKKCDANGADN